LTSALLGWPFRHDGWPSRARQRGVEVKSPTESRIAGGALCENQTDGALCW
jgi:hypothetical protein